VGSLHQWGREKTAQRELLLSAVHPWVYETPIRWFKALLRNVRVKDGELRGLKSFDEFGQLFALEFVAVVSAPLHLGHGAFKGPALFDNAEESDGAPRPLDARGTMHQHRMVGGIPHDFKEAKISFVGSSPIARHVVEKAFDAEPITNGLDVLRPRETQRIDCLDVVADEDVGQLFIWQKIAAIEDSGLNDDETPPAAVLDDAPGRPRDADPEQQQYDDPSAH
jgi:hypothetical protein